MKLLQLVVMAMLFAITPTYAQSNNIDSTKIETVTGRWPEEKINNWYKELPWLVGCNYIPSSAINQLEMWQESTWDPDLIEKELSLANSIGMNTLRVYLHNLVWQNDKEGFYQRMDEFLNICKRHNIKPSFVFFDDCHYPDPKTGKQSLPVYGWHNSGWVNCPARDLAIRYAQGKATDKEIADLKGYIQETLSRFNEDDRVLYWELYNEPGRGVAIADEDEKFAEDGRIGNLSKKLVLDSWKWARSVNPSQPITSCTEGSVGKINIKINQLNSDLYSIHNYGPPEELENLIRDYQRFNRPIIVTEWLARTMGSTVEDCLPVLKKHHVGAINWGFVIGKTQTHYGWTSRKSSTGQNLNVEYERTKGNVLKPGMKVPEPDVWFHDLFRSDGTPYSKNEIEIFKKLTNSNRKWNY